ncbi:MAG: Nif3-like dinuclear metal center hexameric protein, partial [Victivallaceae bacterium]|nr:Nif3-like dinuclear metal center hexameric protein [Victivallaceae bacterium]
RQRRSLLEQYDLNLVRIHGSADEICILDLFAKVLGLENEVFSDEQYLKIYEISPTPLRELAKSVKERTGMSGLRIASAGDMDRMVHRVGLPWGGMGLFVNVDYQQRLLEHGCDVFIAGETDNYGFRFAAECGIPMIETSHEISENPGFRRFSSMLSAAFFDVEFQFYENDCVWEIM